MLFVTPKPIAASDYLPPVEAAKTAAVRLTSPPSQWDDEITQTVIREHPYLPLDQVVVHFQQRDDTNGYALGSVGFANMPHVSIPIIIANREMSPLDVMVVSRSGTGGADVVQGSGDFTEDKVVPLTEENFAAAQDLSQIGQPVADQDIQGTGYTEDGYNMRLPFRGRTVVASLLGASEAQKSVLGGILQQDKQACAGFLLNGTTEVLNAWLSAGEPKGVLTAKLASSSFTVRPAKVASAVPSEVDVSSMFTAAVVVDGGAVKTAMKIDVIDLAAPEKGTSSMLVYDDATFTSGPAKIAAFDDGRSDAERADEIVTKISAAQLSRGTYLMFQLGEAFTRPAKLAAIATRDDQRAVTLRLEDNMARTYEVILDRRVKSASLNNGTWVLPMTGRIFQLAGVASDSPMALDKVAEWFDRQLPDQLVANDGQFSLSIRGEAFGGVMSKAKMASVMSSWISNGQDLLEMAETAGCVRFSSEVPTSVVEAVKTAGALKAFPELAKSAAAELSMPIDKAVKLAAAIGDPQAADMVLGTGFLTEDNLSEFVSMSGQLEDVVGKLARLLIAIRMGFPGDESATVVAMKSLQRVKERLEAAMTEVAA